MDPFSHSDGVHSAVATTPGRIRVLHSLSVVGRGGVERRRLELLKSLDPNRFEQRIIARAAYGPVAEEFRALGCEVAVVGEGSLFAPGSLFRAVRVARSFRPHIVHGAVFEGLPPAIAAGRAVGAKVVVEETSNATNRSARGHALFRALVAAADTCVAVSPAVGAYLTSVTGIPSRKLTVIVNGVAARRRSGASRHDVRRSLGVPINAFVTGTVARLADDSSKRVSDLLRAARLLKTTERRLFWLIVGDGRERERLERLAAALDVTDRVAFAGAREDIGDVLSAIDAFALVSAREAFGMVIPEAMLCGLPVIATAVGGIVDIVEPERTGLLVPPGDPPAIARAVMRLCSDPALRSDLSRAGETRAQSHFSSERYVADVARFYESLVDQQQCQQSGASAAHHRSA